MGDLELAVLGAVGPALRLMDPSELATQVLEEAREEAPLVFAAVRVGAGLAAGARVDADAFAALVALEDAHVGAVLAEAVEARVERVGRFAAQSPPRGERLRGGVPCGRAALLGRRVANARQGGAGVRDGREVAHDGAAEHEREEEEAEDDEAPGHEEHAAAGPGGRGHAVESVHDRGQNGADDGSISYGQVNTGRDVGPKGEKPIGTPHEEAGSGSASNSGSALGGAATGGESTGTEACGNGGSVSSVRRTYRSTTSSWNDSR